jgi:hypothetical protein
MTTTSHMQKSPDFFPSHSDCEKAQKMRECTNPRYKYFRQTHFTAGDPDQFEEYREKMNGKFENPRISVSNPFHRAEIPIWEKFANSTPQSTTNTFNYLFHKFKKGTFVKIFKGKLKVFLPFSNKDFRNEWSHLIQHNPANGSMEKFIGSIQKMEKRQFRPENLNRYRDAWYANNCLLRWEFPIQEGDTNNHMFNDMLKCLTTERKIPDVEFFINKRDFPLMKTDCTEPYDHIFGDDTPLLSHNYTNYTPILSMTTRPGYADIPIPTGEDWSRVCRSESKYFPKTSGRDYSITPTEWSSKTPTAIFRGSSTGAGVKIETNPRLKLAHLSKITEPDIDGIPLLNAGITDWNLRPRKIKGEKYIQTIDINSLGIDLVPRLSPQEQSGYKYIINVDGHVSAFRLGLELSSGSCILLAESSYNLWYTQFLKPNVHYVPIKADLSDLLEKVKWCKSHDAECKRISENAKRFHDKYLTKKGVLDYLQKVLHTIKNKCTPYLYLNPNPIDILPSIPSHSGEPIDVLYKFPPHAHSRSFFRGVEKVVHRLSKFPEGNLLFQNGNVKVEKITLGGIDLVVKKSRKNLRREVASSLLTNTLPGFAYNLGFMKDDNVCIQEHIPGIGFDKWIRESFDEGKFYDLLIELCLILTQAQTEGFVHNDLTPWNIIIDHLAGQRVYHLRDGTLCVREGPAPRIIDMERSFFVHDGIYYGDGELSPNLFKDPYTLLATSISCALNSSRNPPSEKFLQLAKFLTPFKSVGELRYLLSRKTKFSELSMVGRDCLGGKSLGDLLSLLTEISRPLDLTTCSTYDYSVPSQVAQYCVSDSIDEQKLSYVNAIVQIRELPDPETVDRKNALWFWGEIKSYLESLVLQMSALGSSTDDSTVKRSRLFVKQKLEACKNLPLAEEIKGEEVGYKPFDDPCRIMTMIDDVTGMISSATLRGLGDVLWLENIKVLESDPEISGPVVDARIQLLTDLRNKIREPGNSLCCDL